MVRMMGEGGTASVPEFVRLTEALEGAAFVLLGLEGDAAHQVHHGLLQERGRFTQPPRVLVCGTTTGPAPSCE